MILSELNAVQSPATIMNKIRNFVSGDGPTFGTEKSVCHKAVAQEIKRKRVDSDRVVMFGSKDYIIHSILVSVDGEVKVDTMRGSYENGKFTFDGGKVAAEVENVKVSDLLM